MLSVNTNIPQGMLTVTLMIMSTFDVIPHIKDKTERYEQTTKNNLISL